MIRNPRAEAAARLGDGSDVRVLEPSPPASSRPPDYADDPLAGGEVLPIVRMGTRTWAQVCATRRDEDLRRWCQDRWLVAGAPQKLPNAFQTTTQALHAVAEHVIAPCRHQVTGKIGLRFTFRGFGTPFFGDDRQVRVEEGAIVDGDRRRELTTLRQAATFVGIEPGAPVEVYTPTTPTDFDVRLEVDADAARALGDWFGFCAAALSQFREEADIADRPSPIQLWPEHFDLAVDLGADGKRANFGASPGDEGHAEPYVYVGPWEPREGVFWNESFGASLAYADILDGADALAFFRQAKKLLA